MAKIRVLERKTKRPMYSAREDRFSQAESKLKQRKSFQSPMTRPNKSAAN